MIDMLTGDRKLALKKACNPGQPSVDGTTFSYDEDGHYFVYDMASGQSANLTKLVPTSLVNIENDRPSPSGRRRAATRSSSPESPAPRC